MKVEQLINNKGNGAMNQFVITTNNAYYFQSYDSMIAKYDRKSGIITLGRDWDFSKTTMKHLNIFLDDYCHKSGMNKKRIEKAIADGEIVYDENLKYKD